jgi:hypothetical protein
MDELAWLIDHWDGVPYHLVAGAVAEYTERVAAGETSH